MSVQGDAEARITVTAKDEASSEIDRTTKNINRSWVAMRNQQRAVQREFELNNRTLVATTRALQQVGSVLQRVISIYNTWQLMQVRNALATKNLRDAQKDLNDIFLEFGGTSKEYQEALERQREAMEEVKRQRDADIIGWGLMIFQLFTVASTLTSRVLPSLNKVSGVLGKVTGQAKAITPKTPTAGITPKPNVKTPSVFNKVPNAFKNKFPTLGNPKVGSIAGGIGSGLASAGFFLAQLAGEQNAQAPEAVFNPETGQYEAKFAGTEGGAPESGFDQLGKIGEDINITITNIINSPTPQNMINDIINATKQALTFGSK